MCVCVFVLKGTLKHIRYFDPVQHNKFLFSVGALGCMLIFCPFFSALLLRYKLNFSFLVPMHLRDMSDAAFGFFFSTLSYQIYML